MVITKDGKKNPLSSKPILWKPPQSIHQTLNTIKQALEHENPQNIYVLKTSQKRGAINGLTLNTNYFYPFSVTPLKNNIFMAITKPLKYFSYKNDEVMVLTHKHTKKEKKKKRKIKAKTHKALKSQK